ncbi:DUF1833 domain-containing protein [Comamonas thiooxydans]|uniref:DUF1833 family protein n=1 Tax=Comamonas thiooxydans TaxID=363952 RepID=UPI00244AD32E|nr:DUF1833 family protein [Comamonas thiooxydans]MDH1252889.1 DUF1833 domain-containing protein [Comamonas thiooxydans]
MKEDFRTRNQRVTDDVGHIELLEVSNPSFSESMHICNDAQDFVSRGDSYIGLPFGFTLPDDVTGQAPRMRLTMDNVGRGISDELERRMPGTTTMAKLVIVPRDQPDVHQHEYWLPMTSVSISGASAQATCSVDELMRRAACMQIANPHTLPGIS